MSGAPEVWYRSDGVRSRAVHPRGLALQTAMIIIVLLEGMASYWLLSRHDPMSRFVLFLPPLTIVTFLIFAARHTDRSRTP